VTLDSGATLAVTGSSVMVTGDFSQSARSTTTITTGDLLTLGAGASLSGTTSGAGALALAGGNATIASGAQISVSSWSISGAGTDVTLGENLTYTGSFSEAAGDVFALSGGYLLLSGAASFVGGTVNGSNMLETEGATTVSSVTIGGTVEWENKNTVNQSDGTVTIGDASGDKATLDNRAKATYDILDDSGIDRGSSSASTITNSGKLEKTGGTGTSAIAPAVTNAGTIKVSSGTLDLMGAVTGTGTDKISNGSTLEFGAAVSTAQTRGDQDIVFSGGGQLHLLRPMSFYGDISDFGSGDTIKLLGSWSLSDFSESAGMTTLKLESGGSTHAFDFVGSYSEGNFAITSGTTSIIKYHA
jgi:fibronectin-binding autotransporter adhesin